MYRQKNKISYAGILEHILKITSSVAIHFTVAVFLFAAVLLAGLSDAHAIPAFARQTGMECAACHVGSFGPQLTSMGRNFKLHGYTLGNEQQGLTDYLKNLSAMTFGGIVHTDGDQRKGIELTGNEARYNANDNVTVDQTSLFYGGRLFSNVGMLAQVTYSTPDEQVSWDNTDIRFASDTMLGGKSLIYGVTVNNNPSVQDVWQTTPAWSFPYLSSALMPTPTASPYITSLAGSVGGGGVYGMWNNLLYAELSGYATLPDRTQLALGVTGPDQSDHLSSVAPYWRVALQHDFGGHYVELGTYGIYADRYPGNVRDFGTDNFLDYALDATYQFTSENGKHSVSVYGSALREHANLAATYASSGSANPTDNLTNLRANVSYYYNNTYGLTFGPFSTTGSADAMLYANPVNNKPDTTGWTLQADYTPFGAPDSFGYPYFNVRFFMQYTAYDKFNGLSSNYDGTGRNASDNNTLFTGMWFAF
jgi:hypothetical protein